ncbi:transketolase [Phenylobacterium montanum]|uniref:Pyruvate dehydrogenase E1 component n=1 Tax=Phenylobacterium montanum TaxID=2823693 RepID=A0A975G2G1_9CAUL|nr:transketolase [Caulobacter sp. S6]QUD89900.1 transketolase [Caulobacter sp. S6]
MNAPLPAQSLANHAQDVIAELDDKVRWLSAWTIHNANHLRESRDGLKVGGHQASSASMATIMSALYFSVLQPEDRVAVKPHASPVFHAIQYLYGRQSLDQLQRFRSLGGAQSYPSRTKDKDDVDFSTGSVGLGVAMTAFASITQDYMIAHGALAPEKAGRMISLLGDAELDEGNIYECVIEGAKHDLRNCWWIVDYNRQSLDATTWDSMFLRFADIFQAVGWDVITLKYGRKLQAAFARKGGAELERWIDESPNDLYAALSFQGGAAWRARLMADIGDRPGVKALLASYDDDALAGLMTNLAGHDLGLLLDTFHAVKDERPKFFIVYTIKGFGLPFQGHKDNHSGLMTVAQMETFQKRNRVPEGREWDKFAGLPREAAEYEAFLAAAPFAGRKTERPEAPRIAVPGLAEFPRPSGKQSTQVAFGKILNDLARAGGELADAIVTTSPDVTVSTNLGGFVNQRGLFAREGRRDQFKDSNIASPQKWIMGPKGQHIELGIAENNLFLLLAALGLSGDLFGRRVMPVGTLYDPFINRGLDALNYACYQDARFLLVATPSGLTLAPEGGAHQSIHTPLIGMAQDKLSYFEPAYVDELSAIMRWAFGHMQDADGGSVYLRLSTRALEQPARELDEAQLVEGAYWEVEPAAGADLAVVYAGAVAPEAREAFELMLEDVPGAGLLAVPSPDRLHRGWTAGMGGTGSHVERLLSRLAPHAALVTVIDGPPATLSWLGGVLGHKVRALGLERFGQSGDVPDLYRAYRLDAEAILDAAAAALA